MPVPPNSLAKRTLNTSSTDPAAAAPAAAAVRASHGVGRTTVTPQAAGTSARHFSASRSSSSWCGWCGAASRGATVPSWPLIITSRPRCHLASLSSRPCRSPRRCRWRNRRRRSSRCRRHRRRSRHHRPARRTYRFRRAGRSASIRSQGGRILWTTRARRRRGRTHGRRSSRS
ncbi:unnamed protein product, partial [Phaeothamnion confervicola]